MTELFSPPLRYALLAGILASIACGVIGTYVVTRRISLLAGSLAHSVLGGMGAAYYLRMVRGWEWLHPLHGAVVAGLAAAFIVSAARTYANEREDTVISALWAIGMAIGVMFMSGAQEHVHDLTTYLFGNIAAADSQALILLVILDVVVIIVGLMFYNQLLAVCFDEEFARVRGLKTGFYYTLLLCLAAMTIVTLIYVVGIVLVIALLTLPVAVAGHFSKKLWQMMVLSALLSATYTTMGLAFSSATNLPAGATTVLLAGAVYVLVKGLSNPVMNLLKNSSAREKD